MTPFFITGFPRSRSAWLANFLTYKDSFCFHDGIQHCWPDPTKMKELFGHIHEKYVGNSDSGIPFYIDQILEDFPDAKFAIVKRDINDVEASLSRIMGFDTRPLLNLCEEQLAKMEEKVKPLVVAFDELNTVEGCEKVWKHCLPDIPFDYMRWEMLKDLKVEITPSQIERIRRLLCRGE